MAFAVLFFCTIGVCTLWLAALDGELATADRAELLRLIRVQRRQLETLEAVNDQLCEDHERMEQQLESVRSIVHT